LRTDAKCGAGERGADIHAPTIRKGCGAFGTGGSDHPTNYFAVRVAG
jgi:hypothetical protein